ncbi:MAG: type II secretion system protein GspJ [Pseudomonadota bacterium]|nr:type II secretion system protein GspJ [Pseudomonadota bacterium]
MTHPVAPAPSPARSPDRNAESGFTLLEVLVALVLMSVFSLAAYQGLNTVLAAERQALGEMARWRVLALAFTRINNDLRATLPGSLGASQPGFVAGVQENGDWRFAFDRQVAEDEGGGVSRVEYRYARGELRRVEGQATTPLLSGLHSAHIGFLDHQGAWLPTWPTTGAPPRALALDLAWGNGLKLRRVFLAS